MQIHGPSQPVDEIHVYLNPGSGRPFAVVEFGDAELYLESPADADEIIRAAVRAKDMLLGRTGEPAEGSLSRAIAADVDRQTARVWAVYEQEDGDLHEVTDPKTWEEARRWAEVNALSFAGPLTVGRARTHSDEQLSPPAEPGRDTHRPPTGHQLPAADLLADCTGSWETDEASGRCGGDGGHEGQHADATAPRWVHTPAGAR